MTDELPTSPEVNVQQHADFGRNLGAFYRSLLEAGLGHEHAFELTHTWLKSLMRMHAPSNPLDDIFRDLGGDK